ncbi:ABC transporter ATP-binding protein [Nocardioides zeae]|uniref:ABC transporter ATP-binding protein n=1 Tax=Nocardioides imazamoxiresistens TaxID=3231893 RepID=A0ABU3PXJ4_9ACTN|nr:ABC transporter ATP-binding protein [Nocardioides zeae]MDT9593966.1 ABC transporter ATP-binding protein [Nocardioides zeae]
MAETAGTTQTTPTAPGAAPDARDAADLAGRPVLVVDDVHLSYKTFGGRRRSGSKLPGWARGVGQGVGAVDTVHAVKGVSFVAHHGESIGLIGHNGSGKSTLLRAVAGALPVTSGAIYTDGIASLLGVSGALINNLSGERNIILGCLALGLKPKDVRRHYEEVVDFADIGDFVQLPMSAYSSGMGARLRFAISTAASPDILMIDEALATGDAAFKARSQERIDEIRERAGTVLLVSHSMNSIRETCDRVLWLDSGVLRADGRPDEVIDAYLESQRAKVEARKTAVEVPADGAAPLRSTKPPFFVGAPHVESRLEGRNGTWSPIWATSFRYQWLADGEPIPGATAKRITLSQAQVGARISLRVTASRDGFLDGTATSEPSAPVTLLPPLVVTEQPGLVVLPRVGATLEGHDGAWAVGGAEAADGADAAAGSGEPVEPVVHHQWLADGEPIPGATERSFTLTADQVGTRVSLRVTATRDGCADGTAITLETDEVRA